MTGVGYPIEYNYLKYLPYLIFLPRKGLTYAILAVMGFFSISKAGIVDIITIYLVYLIFKTLIKIFIFTMWPVP